MPVFNVYEAKTHLSNLLERAVDGEEIIIARAGRPVAKLVPITRTSAPRVFGQMRGLIHIREDFDDPLPPELLKAFYGEE